MHKVIQVTFPQLEEIFTSKSDLFLNIAQLFPHPDFVLGCSKTVIKNKIRQNTNKRLSVNKTEEKAIALLKAAQLSYPFVSSDDVLCDRLLYMQEDSKTLYP